MLKLLILTLVFAHGVGHVLFLAPTVRFASWADQSGHSWLLEPVVGDSLARVVGAITWTAAGILLIAAVAAFMFGWQWWAWAAVAGALLSLVGIVVMWDGITTGSAVAAAVFDVLIIVAVWLASPRLHEIAGA